MPPKLDLLALVFGIGYRIIEASFCAGLNVRSMFDACIENAMKWTKGNLTMVATLIAVLVLLLTILSFNFQPVLIALNGKLKFAEELGYFKLDLKRQAWIGLLVCVTFIPPVLLQRSLTRVESDYQAARNDTLKAQAAVVDLGERLHSALTLSLEKYDRALCVWGGRFELAKYKCETEFKIDDVTRRLTDVERYILGSGEIAVYGSGHDRVGSLKTTTREIYVFDPKTSKETFVVIVHIFDGLAYWDYGETNLFVELDDESDINLWRHLKTREALRTFGQFDLIVGLGLESNTGEVDNGRSALRAKTLCTNLNVMFENRLDAKVAGLDIGMYRGDKREAKYQRNPRLRPVILVGVNAKGHAGHDAFLEELLVKVRVPELQLNQFENLMEGHRPGWYYQPECRPQYDFVGPTTE